MFRPWNLHGVPLSSFFPAKFQHPGPGGRKGETDPPRLPLPRTPQGLAQHRKPHESPLRLAKCVKKLGPCGSAQAQRKFYNAQLASVFHPEPLQALWGPGEATFPVSPETSGRPCPWLGCLWVACGRLGCGVCARTCVSACACVCRGTPPRSSARDGLLLPRF